jgi:predicted acetyltransferase
MERHADATGQATLRAARWIIVPMNVDIRPFRGTLREWFDAVEIPFGHRVNEEDLPVFEPNIELDRALAAYDGERVVGTAGIYSFRLTVPGGQLPAAGVTMVGVHPTHRRHGILRAMMRTQLEAIRARSEPIAILWASEPAIYGRFGYGLAAFRGSFELARARAGFGRRLPPEGSLRLVERAEAERIFPPIHDAVAATRPGFVSRSPAWWSAEFFHDPERWRRGGGPAFLVVHERDGTPDGYARYRLHGDWDERGPKGALEVIEALARTPAAERELWAYLSSIDLTTTIRASNVPVDTPLRHLLADQRAMGLTVGDALWLRILDLAAALEGRTYATGGRLVLEVDDEFGGDLGGGIAGRWLLETEPGMVAPTARVTPTHANPDLALGATELGAVYLGGTTFGELAGAERVRELTPGALDRGDALFRSARAPWCPAIF